jgi:hypothetical protein
LVAGLLLAGNFRKEVAGDAGLDGESAVEAPLGGGDAED